MYKYFILVLMLLSGISSSYANYIPDCDEPERTEYIVHTLLLEEPNIGYSKLYHRAKDVRYNDPFPMGVSSAQKSATCGLEITLMGVEPKYRGKSLVKIMINYIVEYKNDDPDDDRQVVYITNYFENF